MFSAPKAPELPTVADLGRDLLHINTFQRLTTLLIPFICVAAYICFARHGLWPFAVLSLMYLSFVTYGSISHDHILRQKLTGCGLKQRERAGQNEREPGEKKQRSPVTDDGLKQAAVIARIVMQCKSISGGMLAA
jgi:hypothetical protein